MKKYLLISILVFFAAVANCQTQKQQDTCHHKWMKGYYTRQKRDGSEYYERICMKCNKMVYGHRDPIKHEIIWDK